MFSGCRNQGSKQPLPDPGESGCLRARRPPGVLTNVPLAGPPIPLAPHFLLLQSLINFIFFLSLSPRPTLFLCLLLAFFNFFILPPDFSLPSNTPVLHLPFTPTLAV